MSYPRDLLEQARHLARRERKRPKQASLRRAVSAAYYALFHLLVADGAARVAGRRQNRPAVRRMFEHATMRRVCRSVANGELPHPWGPDGPSLPRELVDLARIFTELQERRHEADYDLSGRFARRDVQSLVEKAEHALRSWNVLRRQHGDLVDSFLLALLFGGRGRR